MQTLWLLFGSCNAELETPVADVDVDGGKPISSNVFVVDSNSFPLLVDAPRVLKAKSRSPIAVMEDTEIARWLRWIEGKTGRAMPEHVLGGDKVGDWLRQEDPMVTPPLVGNRRPERDRPQSQPGPEVEAVEAASVTTSSDDDSARLHRESMIRQDEMCRYEHVRSAW